MVIIPGTCSLNNKLIVEAYKKEALRTTEKNGFAFVAQKLSLKGLRILVDAHTTTGNIPRGWIAYIKEEALHTQAWAQKPLECDSIEGPFLVVDMAFVEFIKDPNEGYIPARGPGKP